MGSDAASLGGGSMDCGPGTVVGGRSGGLVGGGIVCERGGGFACGWVLACSGGGRRACWSSTVEAVRRRVSPLVGVVAGVEGEMPVALGAVC